MSPVGHWSLFGAGFTIDDVDGRLWATWPGYDGVGAVLHPAGRDWRFEGGPVDGAIVRFGTDEGLVGDVIPLRRLPGPPDAIPGSGIAAPTFDVSADLDAEFERLWTSAAGHIEWTVASPKHVFVQWLMARGDVVFHGSNTAGISRFSTERKSVELDDPTGRGNLTAVYASPDGLWASYFAIVDRSRIRGSLRNGVVEFLSTDGHRVTRYHLSLATLDLERRPFAPGTLYVLPRDRFEPIALHDGGPPTMEWACFEPVEPIASLTIDPEDYPFLASIGGHDETDRIRYAEAATVVLEMVEDVEQVEPELVLRLSDVPPAEAAEAYVRLGRLAWPGTERRVDGTLVTIEGPADYRSAIARRFSRSPG